MDVRFTPEGIYLPAIDLWLDPKTRCDNSWISHAHSDHARGLHCNVIATRQTLRIYRQRWPEDVDQPQNLHVLDYGQSIDWHGARLTAYGASHIVGAAQLLVEYAGERLVYTGDIKMRAAICGTATAVVPCNRLIIESTFGLPIFHFLDRDRARERIVQFAQNCLQDAVTPVFVGYSLGRGQEIVHVLCEAGIPTAVHGAIARLIPFYEEAGYSFPCWMPYLARDREHKALVVVPTFRTQMEASGRNIRVAYVSGWAALDNARNRAGAEELIPYSDHGDFEELLQLVEGTGAQEVDVVHGYAEVFSHVLRMRGIAARAPQEAAERARDEEVPEG